MTVRSRKTYLLCTIPLIYHVIDSSGFMISNSNRLMSQIRLSSRLPISIKHLAICPSFTRSVGLLSYKCNIQNKKTNLQMAAEDFQESKYTESAWACIAALPKIADYYSTTSVEAPMLLDVMLNPTKHSAGDSAESAKRITEKVLLKADVDITKLRQELEVYMSKQPKLSSGGGTESQKMMGRSLSKVIERARENKSLLGVRKLC